MAHYRGDAGLLREAVQYAGVKLYDDRVFSDGNIGTRRLKLWRAQGLFDATDAQKKKFMERLKENFGNRVVKYYAYTSSYPYNFQSFVLVVTEDPELQAARKAKYMADLQRKQEQDRIKYAYLYEK